VHNVQGVEFKVCPLIKPFLIFLKFYAFVEFEPVVGDSEQRILELLSDGIVNIKAGALSKIWR
jgi:hypothetical protein